MGNKQTIDEDINTLSDSLKKIRDTRKDRIKYSEEVLKSLNYKKERKPYEFDAFLIKAVDIHFKESQDADIALMAFGLLQGYRYEQTTVTERRYRYLKESDYFPDDLRRKIKPYNEATKEEKDALTGNIRKGRENTCIKWLADFLLDQSSIEKFIEEIDDYIKTVDGKQFAKLPEPSYLKNNRNIQNEPTNGDNTEKSNDIFQTISDNKTESNQQKSEHTTKVEDENSTHKGIGLESDSVGNLVGDEHIEQGKDKHDNPVVGYTPIYKKHEADKANIAAKAESISIAKDDSHVSIHITNVIGEQEILGKKLKDQDSLSPKNTEEDDKPPKKKKCPKWIIGFVIISLFLFIYYILKLNLGFTINTQLQMKKPSAIGQNQYQEEDPFSQQMLDLNFGININLSISSSIADDENGEPVVNDKPISEPIEEGSE